MINIEDPLELQKNSQNQGAKKTDFPVCISGSAQLAILNSPLPAHKEKNVMSYGTSVT